MNSRSPPRYFWFIVWVSLGVVLVSLTSMEAAYWHMTWYDALPRALEDVLLVSLVTSPLIHRKGGIR
jgi:hypothetical protein